MNKLFNDFSTHFIDLKPLKNGGQKTVFTGIHDKLGMVVLKTGNFSSLNGLERIKREINFLQSLSSNYYPKIFEFIIDENGKTFLIIEEYIKNKNIEDVRNYFNSEDKLISLLRELIKALSIMWDKKIIHRDLKPDNILFKENYCPVIIDLGIARFLSMESLTQTIALRGPCTPIYAAPEQLLNQKNLIDIRSDFFCIGIILLEFHLGFHPYSPDQLRNSNSIPENIISGIYVPASHKIGTTKRFDLLIRRLLGKEQFQRFRNYNDILTFTEK